jgi:hypothetical protein
MRSRSSAACSEQRTSIRPAGSAEGAPADLLMREIFAALESFLAALYGLDEAPPPRNSA